MTKFRTKFRHPLTSVPRPPARMAFGLMQVAGFEAVAVAHGRARTDGGIGVGGAVWIAGRVLPAPSDKGALPDSLVS
jgi:hypothetical protein